MGNVFNLQDFIGVNGKKAAQRKEKAKKERGWHENEGCSEREQSKEEGGWQGKKGWSKRVLIKRKRQQQ